MLSCLDFPLRVPSLRPREVVACGLPRNGIRHRRSSSLSTVSFPPPSMCTCSFYMDRRYDIQSDHEMKSQNGTTCAKNFLNVVYHGPFVCPLPNGRTHGRPSREVGKSNSAEGQGDIDAYYEDTIHDPPVAVMNRSISNLAMERDLIVARSEDLTSMKNSIITKENESTVGNQNPRSLANPDDANSVDQKTEVGIVDDDQLKNVQEVEQSKEHALGRLKETNLDYRITAEEHEPESNNQSQNFLLNLDIMKNGQLDSTHTLTSSDSFGQSTETGTINNDKGLTNNLEDEHLEQLKQKSLEPYTLEEEPDSNDQSKFIPHLVVGDTRELSGTNASWTPSDSYAQSTHADDGEKLMKGLEAEKSTEEVARNQFQVVPPEEGNSDSLPLAGSNVMNVIVVAAECTPWSKTGGLGDVVGDLPKALARRGHRVMVVVPKYDNYSELKELGVLRRYKADGQDLEVTYYHAYIDCVDFVFIDSPVFRHIGNDIYGGHWQDILKRMVLFCKAAVEVPWYVPCGGFCYGDGNLVFIANDWHTALLPVYLKAYYRNNGLMIYTRCVLVIHNVAHQGRCPLDQFACLDLPEHYMDLFRLYDPVGGEHLNIFAAGLKCADQVVTVSHGYAWELKTSEGGWGLHEIINEIGWKFRGIVNGINTQTWNPKFDVFLTSDGYTNYNLETLQVGKPQCKAALQRELGLPVRDDAPIFAFIGRLDGQKGIDLIEAAMPWLVGQDLQLVMLGTGRRDLEDMLRRFGGQYPNKVRGWVGFSDKMAHRITAGADVLLMPSKFEPCGLNQLYAMMYGTVPVVHAVGGLRDTVKQFDPFRDAGLGWTFEKAEANRMVDAIAHCSNTYRNYKESWKGLQMRGMMQNFSWDYAAQLYEQVLVAAKYQW